MVQFSPASLRRFLDSSFSGRSTAISELLQNARRAGASEINVAYSTAHSTLTFTDNGCGIADAAVLLTPGDSDWSDSVMQQDDPFGLGFRAALLNAKHVRVESKFGAFEADTDSLLDGVLPEIQPGDYALTRITLIEPKIPQIEEALRRMAACFPVPVKLNGLLVNSIEWAEVDETERYVLKRATNTGRLGSAIRPTIQGLPVQVPHNKLVGPLCVPYSFERSTVDFVLELKDADARMPDRDALRNPEDVPPYDLIPSLLKLVEQTDDPNVLWPLFEKDKLREAIFARHGLIKANVYAFQEPEGSYFGLRLDGEGGWLRNTVAAGRVAAPSFDVFPSGEFDNDEGGLVAAAWATAADMECELPPLSSVLNPCAAFDELVWQIVPQNVTLDVERLYGNYRVVCCTGLEVTPLAQDEDGNTLHAWATMTLDHSLHDYVNDVLYVVDGSVWELERQFSNHMEEGEGDWDEDACNEFTEGLSTKIALAQQGDKALPQLAAQSLGSLPKGCVGVQRVDRFNGRTAMCLSNADGEILPEGVAAFALEFPTLARAIGAQKTPLIYRTVEGAAAASLAQVLILDSVWFECEPEPDDRYTFAIKAENLGRYTGFSSERSE